MVKKVFKILERGLHDTLFFLVRLRFYFVIQYTGGRSLFSCDFITVYRSEVEIIRIDAAGISIVIGIAIDDIYEDEVDIREELDREAYT